MIPAGVASSVDPYHSAINFTVRHLGISKVRGRFRRFDAALIVGETFPECAVTATIAVNSIDTGNADRDAHVLAADMLDVEHRPTILAVEFGGLREFVVDSRRHAGFEATGQIRRSDFGLALGAVDAVVGDVVKLQLDVQFVEPA